VTVAFLHHVQIFLLTYLFTYLVLMMIRTGSYQCVCLYCSEMEAVLMELSRLVAERDVLAAQMKTDALTVNDRIQQATKQGSKFSFRYTQINVSK